jgi:23S rRNA-/tRNA-specific pseudouridylate synthase
LPSSSSSLDYSGLTPAHRLDKPVSGVLLFGKSRRQVRGLSRVSVSADMGV